MRNTGFYERFTAHSCLHDLNWSGAICIANILGRPERESLMKEAIRQAGGFVRHAGAGADGIEQIFSSLSPAPSSSGDLFQETRRHIEENLQEELRSYDPYPFPERLAFNETLVHVCFPASGGISPRRDGSRYRNLVAILILEGRARFGLCDNREKEHIREMRNEPGDLILLQAPGFCGSGFRPFHFVDNVQQRWTAVTLRQTLDRP